MAPDNSRGAAHPPPPRSVTVPCEGSTVPLTRATRFDELKATSQLPSPKGVALAILRLAESETTTVRDAVTHLGVRMVR